MPMTDAERSRNYRKRKCEAEEADPTAAKKQAAKAAHERERYRKRVEAAKSDPLILKKLRLEWCQASRKVRRMQKKQNLAKARNATIEEEKEPYYKSKASLGRARKRLRCALPPDPAGTLQLLKSMEKELDVNIECRPKHQTRPVVSVEHKAEARDFYLRDDISVVSPGKKDYVSIKKRDGSKEKKQLRFLVMSICEAYRIFKSQKEFSKNRVGKSLFFELRPPWVLSITKTPHNYCVCDLCANVKFLLGAIPNDIEFPRTISELIASASCDPERAECAFDTCDDCKNVEHLRRRVRTIANDRLQTICKYKQWSKATKKQRQRPELHETTLRRVFDLLFEKLTQSDGRTESFRAHVFIKRAQAAEFRKQKSEVSDEHFVMQCDFSQNAVIGIQDMTQAVYYNVKEDRQVTVYTAVVWAPRGQVESFAICSDYLVHDKDCVCIFNRKIIRCLKKKYPKFKQLSIWSDGSVGEFKNRFIMYDLTTRFKNTKVTATWNFFATHHGKGSADAIGGTVKRQVQAKIYSRPLLKDEVKDAQSYAACAETVCPSISILFIDKAEILQKKEELAEVWAGLKDKVPQIKKQYCFEPLGGRQLRCKRVSSFLQGTVFKFVQ